MNKAGYRESYNKVLKTIDSCKTRKHLECTERLIFLFVQMFQPCDADSHDLKSYLLRKYEELKLEYVYDRKFSEIQQLEIDPFSEVPHLTLKELFDSPIFKKTEK